MDIQPQSFLRALSDETRLRILVLLQSESELCVCELTRVLQMVQPKISRHLAILRDQGILLDRRQGHWVYYRINPEIPAWSWRTLTAITEGAHDRAPFSEDRLVLNAAASPEDQCGS